MKWYEIEGEKMKGIEKMKGHGTKLIEGKGKKEGDNKKWKWKRRKEKKREKCKEREEERKGNEMRWNWNEMFNLALTHSYPLLMLQS